MEEVLLRFWEATRPDRKLAIALDCEMVAAIYETGQDEGILFLDEVNCVSETLAPVMRQLLQAKTFGTHRIPDGWMIVAAGNPREYNHAVRPLDMAALDRVKHMEIEADLDCWMAYA